MKKLFAAAFGLLSMTCAAKAEDAWNHGGMYAGVPMPWPPSVNSYWRSIVIGGSPRVLISRAGRQYRVDVQAAVLERFGDFRTVKVKVAEGGQTLDDDIARVAAARVFVGDEGRVRIDANGGWNVDEAEHAIRALEKFDLEYVEQPCATVAELAELREQAKHAELGSPLV